MRIIKADGRLYAKGLHDGLVTYTRRPGEALSFPDDGAAAAWWSEHMPSSPPMGEGSVRTEEAPRPRAQSTTTNTASSR